MEFCKTVKEFDCTKFEEGWCYYVHWHDITGKPIKAINVLHSKDDINNKKYILPHKGGLIKIDFPYKELQDRLTFKLCFSNQFGDKYSQKINIFKFNEHLIRIETQIILTIENQEEP